MDKKEQILHYHRIDGLSQREVLTCVWPVNLGIQPVRLSVVV